MTTQPDTGITRSNAAVDLAPFEIDHPSPFLCELTVDDRHLSRAVEHVSNIEYVRWLDRAAELHSDALGYTRETMLRENVMWFVARHEIDYRAEAWRGDRIVIATWVRSFKRVKSWRDYVMIRMSDKKMICRAATLWVFVDLATRKPKRIPQEMIDRFSGASNLRMNADGRR